jgi:hypothetical protein
MNVKGKKIWAVPGIKIPMKTTGDEPEFTSHEKIAVLNTNNEECKLEMTFYFENDEPVGPFEIEIKPWKLRKIRFNDLIDPQALELEKACGCLIICSLPVVVQYSRMDTGKRENAQISTIAYPFNY